LLILATWRRLPCDDLQMSLSVVAALVWKLITVPAAVAAQPHGQRWGSVGGTA
jgi:hypothetical protein